MGTPLRLYLDNADLCDMADGHAVPHDEALQAAVSDTRADVIYSPAHLLDVVDMKDDSFDRWIQIVDALGPAFWLIASEGNAQTLPVDVDGILGLREMARAWRDTKERHLDAAAASRDASLLSAAATGKFPFLSPTKLREYVAELLDGQHWDKFDELAKFVGEPFRDQLASFRTTLETALATTDLSREHILAQVAEPFGAALARGGIVAAVRANMRSDYKRKPLPSDPVDPEHAGALPHVDVFTADKYTFPHAEKVIRTMGLRTVLVRNKRLPEVVDALRDLAAGRRPRQTSD